MEKESRKRASDAPTLRQSMAGLHSWAGLLLGWLLYAMFLTGGASYFREEISQWMRPEIPALHSLPPADLSTARAAEMLQGIAAASAQWVIDLPSARTNVIAVTWHGVGDSGRALLDPNSGDVLHARTTFGGEFFYYFHFSLHYLPRTLGRWLVGLATMCMLMALISGVIVHKKIFSEYFTFRPGKGARSWLDAHNVLSVLALPFHLMITYTGLVTLMMFYMPWGMKLLNDEQRLALRSELTAFAPPTAPSGQTAKLTDVSAIASTAEEVWGKRSVARVIVDNPNDAASKVRVVHVDTDRLSISPRFMVFQGTDGKLLATKEESSATFQTHGVMYGLHVGRFADVVVRLLYFISSLIGAAMVATGLLLWTVKRRARFGVLCKPFDSLWIVERLNVATIAGLPIAMAVFFWANRLLPLDLGQRSDWEVNLFFLAWGSTLLHTVIQPTRKAWHIQLTVAALLFGGLPLWNMVIENRNAFSSWQSGDLMFFIYEIGLLAIAGSFFAASRKL